MNIIHRCCISRNGPRKRYIRRVADTRGVVERKKRKRDKEQEDVTCLLVCWLGVLVLPKPLRRK